MAFKRMFSYAKVDVPNRSGHNVDHRHAFSAKCGTLVPSFSDFLIPGDTVDLSPKFSVQMAPQATDFIGRISLRTELFFVPLRAIWGGWKDFITYASEGIGGPAPDDPNYHAKFLPGAKVTFTLKGIPYKSPIIVIPTSSEDLDKVFSDYLVYLQLNITNTDKLFSTTNPLGPASLADYLGFKISADASTLDSSGLGLIVTFFTMAMLSDSNLSQKYSAVGNSPVYMFMADVQDYSQGVSFSASVPPSGTPYVTIDTNLVENGGQFTFTFNVNDDSITKSIIINNILKAVAYHKIFDDWYRDARLMKKLFPNALGDNPQNLLGNIAYITKFGGGFNKKYYEGDQLKFYDGKSLFDLRQRLWQKDFFTTMTQAPQSGDAMKVQVTPDADNPNISGEFTIASLRLANAMQLWRERNNLVDSRYGDVQYAQYGVYPSDAVTDRAIYLGSNTVEIYNKSVYQQGEYEGPSNNPIKGIGTKYATPVGVGQGNLCNNYSVTEHGILMALTSIVPEPSYSSGTRRDFHYNTIDDIAFPLLQGVGDQPVYAREIIDIYSGEGDKTVIGYTGRYSEYKFINDHISGLLRDGQSLSAFALQRSFTEPPVLGADFLEIPEDYLDQVSAVGVENSKYGAWIESYWRYSKVSCLSEYNAVPTLGRMPDVHQITVTKAGSRL